MGKLIQQKVRFPVGAQRLYRLYLDAKEHGGALGSKVVVRAKEGSAFSSWDGYISGKILRLVEGRQVVQTWRASDWASTDPDSILILSFNDVPGGGEIEMVHAGVPGNQAASLAKGWNDYYWAPWKAHFGAPAGASPGKKKKPR